MQAVISVTGKDSIGIIAKTSNKCAEHNVNIVDVSQTILQDYFVMIMLADIDNINIPFSEFVDIMSEMGKANNLEIHTMHEDIFNSMHRI
ncbi:MAG: ACT domain-containing protein [Clostridia bacterium]|nr:ACT domain-containing protein [Clostridia bacterium]